MIRNLLFVLLLMGTVFSSKIYVYDNVEVLRNIDTLNSGSTVRTLGYYEPNDGGGTEYFISESEGDINLYNGQYAVLKAVNPVNVNHYGIMPSGDYYSQTEDNYESGSPKYDSLWGTLLKKYRSIYIPNGTYLVDTTLTLENGTTIIGESRGAIESEVVHPTDTHDIIDFHSGTVIQMKNTRFFCDRDLMVVGWDCTIKNLMLKQNKRYSCENFEADSAGQKGTLRFQDVYHKEAEKKGWDTIDIGGLSYRNLVEDVTCMYGQSYNIFIMNGGYTTLNNVRALEAKGEMGNLYIKGRGSRDSTEKNMPVTTTVTINGGIFSITEESSRGSGICIDSSQTITLNNVIIEANDGVGLHLIGSTNITVNSAYLENNLLNSKESDYADIVVEKCNSVNLISPLICSNNADVAIKSDSLTINSILLGGHITKQGGEKAEVDIKGWQHINDRQFLTVCEEGENNSWKWKKYSDGTALVLMEKEYSGINVTAGVGSFYIANSSISIVDFPFDFKATSSTDLDMNSHISVKADNNQYLWKVSSGFDTYKNALRFRVASPVPLSSASFKVNAIIHTRWR